LIDVIKHSTGSLSCMVYIIALLCNLPEIVESICIRYNILLVIIIKRIVRLSIVVNVSASNKPVTYSVRFHIGLTENKPLMYKFPSI